MIGMLENRFYQPSIFWIWLAVGSVEVGFYDQWLMYDWSSSLLQSPKTGLTNKDLKSGLRLSAAKARVYDI